MATQLEAPASYPSDPVSNVLKWILLIVAIVGFAVDWNARRAIEASNRALEAAEKLLKKNGDS